jgi:hypothetical protein
MQVDHVIGMVEGHDDRVEAGGSGGLKEREQPRQGPVAEVEHDAKPVVLGAYDRPMEAHSATAQGLWFAGVRVIVRVDAAQSDGRVGVCESEESRGVRLPLHVHTREDEQVVVLEGEILVRVAERTHALTPGGGGSRLSARHCPSMADDDRGAPRLRRAQTGCPLSVQPGR